MFWNNFVTLCNEKGISANGVCSQLGLSNATATKWKSGSVPRSTTLKKIADYFGVSVEQLIGKPGKYDRLEVGEITFDLGLFGDVQDQEVDEMTELLQELKTRPEMRMLFSLAKGATKEDVELAVAIIQRMRQSGDGE